MKIIVRNRQEVEQLPIELANAYISVTPPGMENAKLPTNEKTKGVIFLSFHDISDIRHWKPSEDGMEPILFNEIMANEILDFLDKNKDVDILCVNCNAGISRSTAIASVLCEIVGQDNTEFITPPKFPNRLTKSLLKRAYLKRKGIEIE